ncbi:hypothetical protein KAU93_03025 [Candidatus Bathyarchaeota archaeon]|nr:hypothetical protein [Candidatus Bathyarchaeota archaeon]
MKKLEKTQQGIYLPRWRALEYSTAGALKDFGLDWSHFNIQARLFEVHGIEENSDVALSPNASTKTKLAGIPLKLPVLTGAFKTF